MNSEQFMENLLNLLPYWHLAIDKTLKQSLKGKMSLESYYCLQTLRRCGPLSMSELARRLKISRQQATQTAERLCEYGFVQRLYDNADRRSIRLEITDKALQYIDLVYFRDTDYLEKLRSRIGEKKLEELDGAVRTLLQILPFIEE